MKTMIRPEEGDFGQSWHFCDPLPDGCTAALPFTKQGAVYGLGRGRCVTGQGVMGEMVDGAGAGDRRVRETGRTASGNAWRRVAGGMYFAGS